MAKKSKKTSSQTYVLPTIIFIVFIISIGVVFARTLVTGNNSREDIVNLPSIDISMTSSDGTSHTVYATFSLDLANGAGKTLNSDTANSLIKEKISTLDYDIIVSKDGYDLIKHEVAGIFKEQLGEDFLDVYITELYQDLRPAGSSSGGTTNKYDRVKNLFGNN